MPSVTPMEPEYPFQHLCADFFHHEGVTYLVLAAYLGEVENTEPCHCIIV